MIADGHCDTLLRIWQDGYDFQNAEELMVSMDKWRKSEVILQAFAIFVPPKLPEEQQYQAAKDMLDIFKEKVIQENEDVVHIKNKEDIENLKEGQRGAILTLEGCHPIGEDLDKLRYLIDDGIRLVGLTWNNSNAVADSIVEENPKGITDFGKDVIEYLNQESIWIDTSHLSDPGFDYVYMHAKYPITSHSNARSLCSHVRNLKDAQIDKVIKQDGLLGMNFCPLFLNDSGEVNSEDIIRHIRYVLDRGGKDVLCLGSDFDGIASTPSDVSTIEEMNYLADIIRETFPKEAHSILADNFMRKFPGK